MLVPELATAALRGLRVIHLHAAYAALDKTLPAPAERPMALPGAALLDLPYELAIDSLHIRRGTLRYRERSDATGKWALIVSLSSQRLTAF